MNCQTDVFSLLFYNYLSEILRCHKALNLNIFSSVKCLKMMAGGGVVKNLFSNVFSNEPSICKTSKSSNSQCTEQSALVKVKTYPMTIFEEDGISANLGSWSQSYDLWQVQLFLNHPYLSKYKIYQTVNCTGTDTVLSGP